MEGPTYKGREVKGVEGRGEAKREREGPPGYYGFPTPQPHHTVLRKLWCRCGVTTPQLFSKKCGVGVVCQLIWAKVVTGPP